MENLNGKSRCSLERRNEAAVTRPDVATGRQFGKAAASDTASQRELHAPGMSALRDDRPVPLVPGGGRGSYITPRNVGFWHPSPPWTAAEALKTALLTATALPLRVVRRRALCACIAAARERAGPRAAQAVMVALLLAYAGMCGVAAAAGADPAGRAPALRRLGRGFARALLFVMGFHWISVEGVRQARDDGPLGLRGGGRRCEAFCAGGPGCCVEPHVVARHGALVCCQRLCVCREGERACGLAAPQPTRRRHGYAFKCAPPPPSLRRSQESVSRMPLLGRIATALGCIYVPPGGARVSAVVTQRLVAAERGNGARGGGSGGGGGGGGKCIAVSAAVAVGVSAALRRARAWCAQLRPCSFLRRARRRMAWDCVRWRGRSGAQRVTVHACARRSHARPRAQCASAAAPSSRGSRCRCGALGDMHS